MLLLFFYFLNARAVSKIIISTKYLNIDIFCSKHNILFFHKNKNLIRFIFKAVEFCCCLMSALIPFAKVCQSLPILYFLMH